MENIFLLLHLRVIHIFPCGFDQSKDLRSKAFFSEGNTLKTTEDSVQARDPFSWLPNLKRVGFLNQKLKHILTAVNVQHLSYEIERAWKAKTLSFPDHPQSTILLEDDDIPTHSKKRRGRHDR